MQETELTTLVHETVQPDGSWSVFTKLHDKAVLRAGAVLTAGAALLSACGSTTSPDASPSTSPATASRTTETTQTPTTTTTTKNPDALNPDAINALRNNLGLFAQQTPDVKRALAMWVFKDMDRTGDMAISCGYKVANGKISLCDSNPVAEQPSAGDDGRTILFERLFAEQTAKAMRESMSGPAGGALDARYATEMLAAVTWHSGNDDKSGHWNSMAADFNKPGALASSIQADISYAPGAQLDSNTSNAAPTGIQVYDYSTKAINQVVDGIEVPVKQVLWGSTRVPKTLSTFGLATFKGTEGTNESLWLELDSKPAPSGLNNGLVVSQ